MEHMKPFCNDVSAQPSIFTSIRWPKAKPPKRSDVLGVVSKSVQWGELEATVRPFYQADARKTGRPGYSLSMMLRTYVLQMLWHMSDRQAEACILDSHEMCKFIGSDPWAPRPPSASAIRAFRALLEASTFDDGESFQFVGIVVDRLVNEALRNHGLEYRPGLIRDPVFRKVPARTGTSAVPQAPCQTVGV